MNYLAHLALSGTEKDIIYGNFIGDAIKGKSILQLEDNIQKGVFLHRSIDDFTDSHELVIQCKRLFYDDFPKVSGIIVDILFDRLLSHHWHSFYNKDLEMFIDDSYNHLIQRQSEMPEKMKFIFEHMHNNDWLRRYQSDEGTTLSISQIGKRIRYPKDLGSSWKIYKENKEQIHEAFQAFYQDLQNNSNRILYGKA